MYSVHSSNSLHFSIAYDRRCLLSLETTQQFQPIVVFTKIQTLPKFNILISGFLELENFIIT